eukprot:4166753-Prymnesium_polylepis.1
MSASFLAQAAERVADASSARAVAPMTSAQRTAALDAILAAFGDSRDDYILPPTSLESGATPTELMRRSVSELAPLRLSTSPRDDRFVWSLVLDADSTDANAAILALEHEPTGRFWESVAEHLLLQDAALAHIQQVDFDDSVDEQFCACRSAALLCARSAAASRSCKACCGTCAAINERSWLRWARAWPSWRMTVRSCPRWC